MIIINLSTDLTNKALQHVIFDLELSFSQRDVFLWADMSPRPSVIKKETVVCLFVELLVSLGRVCSSSEDMSFGDNLIGAHVLKCDAPGLTVTSQTKLTLTRLPPEFKVSPVSLHRCHLAPEIAS